MAHALNLVLHPPFFGFFVEMLLWLVRHRVRLLPKSGLLDRPIPLAMIYNKKTRTIIKEVNPHTGIGNVPRESSPEPKDPLPALVVPQEGGQFRKECEM